MTSPDPTPQDDQDTDLEQAPPVSPAYSTPPPDAPGTAEND